MLTDPLLDPRVIQAVYGLARARGATFASYMGTSTQLMAVPDEAKPMLERATFVVSTWFASVIDPFCIGLRRKKGQRWVKITFFRNLDLLEHAAGALPDRAGGRDHPRHRRGSIRRPATSTCASATRAARISRSNTPKRCATGC